MILLYKSYKFRLYPNKEQEILINKTFGCVRFIYNKMLYDKIEHYKETGKLLNITPAYYKKEFEWLKEVDSQALNFAKVNLEMAYNNFFKSNNFNFPKFKSKKNTKLSYTTYNNVSNNGGNGSIEVMDNGRYIKLPKLKQVRVKAHRQIGKYEVIKSCTISKAPSGKYYISILLKYEKEMINKKITDESQVVGLDFSMKELYYSTEGKIANYPRYYRNSLEKLAIEQRKLSRKKKGGKNREKQRIKVARLHEHIANQRNDFLHKKSRELVNRFDAVCIEDLNMKSMSQCLNFGKSVHDNGWGTFTNFLGYKLSQNGKQLIMIGKWYPSSKTCSNCGSIKEKLKLSERVYNCENCGLSIDRDYNASINIKRVGMTQLAW